MLNRKTNDFLMLHNPSGEYFKIGLAIDETIFSILNCVTRKIGAQAADLEVLVRNYSDGITSESEFIDDLSIFGKKAEDLGVSFEINQEDISEINKLWDEGIKGESEC